MARTDRLFNSQADFLTEATKIVASESGEKYLLGTWGLSRQGGFSRVATLLYKLNLCERPVEILIGMNQVSEFGRMINLIMQYKKISFRFTEDSHAKYFVWKNPGKNGERPGRDYFGLIGSANLSDSEIWNLMCRVPAHQIAKVVHEHNRLWKEAKTAAVIATSMRGGLHNLMTRTITFPNDTGGNRTPAG